MSKSKKLKQIVAGVIVTLCALLCGMLFIIPVLKLIFHIDFSQDYRQVEGVENIVFQANWNPELYYERCFWGLKRAEVPEEFAYMQQQADAEGWEECLSSEYVNPGNKLEAVVLSPDGNFVLYMEIDYNYKNSGLTDDEYCYYRVYDVKEGTVVTIYEAYQEWYRLMWK